jgi:hypothetical protein
LENKALKAVIIKNRNINMSVLFLNPFTINNSFRLKREVTTQPITKAESNNPPKGRQKQNNTGKT